MMLQLNPPLPVSIKNKEGQKGLAHFLLDYGAEHHVIWGVALDNSGEVWWVSNPELRLQGNWTMGRTSKCGRAPLSETPIVRADEKIKPLCRTPGCFGHHNLGEVCPECGIGGAGA